MHVGKVLRQLERACPQATTYEAVQHFVALAARGLAVFMIEIGQVDESVAAPLDQELLAVVLHGTVAPHLAELGHHKLCELVAAGGSELRKVGSDGPMKYDGEQFLIE